LFLDGLDESEDESDEELQVKVVTEEPKKLNFQFNDSLSPNETKNQVSPTLKINMEATRPISPTLKISPERSISPTLKFDQINEDAPISPTLNIEENNLSLDLSDTVHSGNVSPTLDISKQEKIQEDMDDDDTDAELSPVLEPKVDKTKFETKQEEKPNSMNLNTDTESMNLNTEQDDETDIELTPRVDEQEKTPKQVEKIKESKPLENIKEDSPKEEKEDSDTDIDLTPIMATKPEISREEIDSIDLNLQYEKKETIDETIEDNLQGVMDSDEGEKTPNDLKISQEYNGKRIIEETQINSNSEKFSSDSKQTLSTLETSLVISQELSQEIEDKPKNLINETLGSTDEDKTSQRSQTTTRKRKRKEEVRASKKIKLTPKIMFTGIDEKDLKKYQKMATKLGGIVCEDLSEITHLITDKVHRTKKFLCALSQSHIVSLNWV
jgi:hypothetical protein